MPMAWPGDYPTLAMDDYSFNAVVHMFLLSGINTMHSIDLL